MRTNIIICDDHKMIRTGIRAYLEGKKQYNVVAEASDGFEALSILENNDIDLVLTDINMPNLNGLDLIKMMKSQFIDTKVLAITMSSGNQIKQIMDVGADGYLAKNCREDQLTNAIDEVMEKEHYLSEEDVKQIAKNDKMGKLYKLRYIAYIGIILAIELVINYFFGSIS